MDGVVVIVVVTSHNTTYSFNHNCQTAGVHRIKQCLGLAIQKLINFIIQHYNGKISQLLERYSRKVVSRNMQRIKWIAVSTRQTYTNRWVF